MDKPLLVFINPNDTSRHTSSANTAIYPNLGLLTLMSALQDTLPASDYDYAYLDGTAIGNATITTYLSDNAHRIAMLAVTALTSNYGAGLSMCRDVLAINPCVLTVMGNDHFSSVYERAMLRRPEIQFGFYGNDVVRGFAAFVADSLHGRRQEMTDYPGLIWRTADGAVRQNSENPGEYPTLPLVDYSLIDSAFPHSRKYLSDQSQTYFFMRERELRSQVIDIGRGCIKFAGPRMNQIPLNACDFCGIIPGVKEILTPDVERAWAIIKNAYDHGYNYFYVTADELPLTMWPMLRGMINAKPQWYTDLPDADKPGMFGYTRAEAFVTAPDRIQSLIDELGFDHFFIGFDGMSDISLRVMNKQAMGGRGRHDSPMEHNLKALDSMVAGGGLVTAGLVVTHLGITPEIMDMNLARLEEIVEAHPRTFAALDFGPLCPIPGSQSFSYLTNPEHAETRADSFGLRVDRDYLESRKNFYQNEDEFDMDELIHDFTRGCCPDISPDMVDHHIDRITALANKYDIVVGGGV